jgi:hypothetical protein
MSTLSIKILNPKARNILDDLANVGFIEVSPYTSAIADFQREMKGIAETHGIRDENDVARIVAEIRREMQDECPLNVKNRSIQ